MLGGWVRPYGSIWCGVPLGGGWGLPPGPRCPTDDELMLVCECTDGGGMYGPGTDLALASSVELESP